MKKEKSEKFVYSILTEHALIDLNRPIDINTNIKGPHAM